MGIETKDTTLVVLGPQETGVSGTVVAADTQEVAEAIIAQLKDDFASERKEE